MTVRDFDMRICTDSDGADSMYVFGSNKLVGGGSFRYAWLSQERKTLYVLTSDRSAAPSKTDCKRFRSLSKALKHIAEFLKGQEKV